ncbi:peptidase family M20/M25/M40 [Colletotrichum truncatum]|uniref:Peptidase family M20/M25/M40 n=1 Tax=Colletotrichum truncatum TaxID=5467 RepID=A0ACC3YYG7_COLTU|nr:peptidase family M20/M25/M40 [Colletotrichum truncatum]KAF6782041.1 peptidase family M20/M25/M40 [Colletotrichum truncatum]
MSEKLPFTNPPAPESRRRRTAWWSLIPAALLLTYLHAPSVVPSFGGHHGGASPASGACHQVSPLLPTLTTSSLSELDKYLDTPKFRNETVARLSGAVKIPTESFDDYGKVGEDDRWDKLFAFSEYLLKTFPKVHEHLKLEKVNTHGLLYTWQGSDAELKPTVLMAHQDTVPVAPTTIDSWTHPPFSGTYDGKFVWGRGAMDCKNSLIGILESVELLLGAGFEPKRTLVLSFGFDEEISGARGAGHLAPTLIERYGKDGAAILIDEGSGFDTQWGQTFALPGTAEKGYIDVEIVVRTPGGHSSIPPPHTGIGIVSEIVTKVEGSPYEPELLPGNPYLGKLQCGAAYAPDFPSNLRKLLPRGEQQVCKRKTDRLAKEAAKAGPQVKYLFTTSVAADIIDGGVKSNALPERTRVLVNHRVNVGDTPASVKKHLTNLIRPIAEKYNLTLQAFSGAAEAPSSINLLDNDRVLEPAPVTPTSVDGVTPYGILSGTTRALYGEEIVVSPGIMTGNTDTRYYWDLTKHIFRFLPGFDPESDEWAGIHTVDEKTSVKGHINLVKWYTTFLRNIDEAEFQ